MVLYVWYFSTSEAHYHCLNGNKYFTSRINILSYIVSKMRHISYNILTLHLTMSRLYGDNYGQVGISKSGDYVKLWLAYTMSPATLSDVKS